MDTEWFKTHMKRRKVSQEALASALGRDRSAVSRIINGKQPMEFWHVEIFARLLDCPPEEILRRAGLPIGEAYPHAARSEDVAQSLLPPQLPQSPADDDEFAFALAEVLAGMTGIEGFPKLPRGRLAQMIKAEAQALIEASEDPDERQRMLDFAVRFLSIYLAHSG